MQISDRSGCREFLNWPGRADESPIEVLYFADSMGSMEPEDVFADRAIAADQRWRRRAGLSTPMTIWVWHYRIP